MATVVKLERNEQGQTQVSKNTNGGFKFYKADTAKLEKAIESTGKFPTEIASAGGLGKDTLKNARDGKRVTKVKADGICNGLNHYSCKPKAVRDDLFPYSEDGPLPKNKDQKII